MSGASLQAKIEAQNFLAANAVMGKLEAMLNELCRAKPADTNAFIVVTLSWTDCAVKGMIYVLI